MAYLERLPRWGRFLAGTVAVGAIGALDYLSGYQVSLAALYVVPILLAAWYIDRTAAFALAALSAAAAFVSDEMGGKPYPNWLYAAADFTSALCVNVILAVLLSSLKLALEREKQLARTDPTTGVFNGRWFRELLDTEIERLRRYHRIFSLAYLDLDGFKVLDDTHGHATGDAMLRTVAETVKRHLRAADVLARLGGDEFAILLPETSAAAAESVVAKLIEAIHGSVDDPSRAVTFSVGLVTFAAAPSGTHEALRLADELMYQAKAQGKDRACSAVWSA